MAHSVSFSVLLGMFDANAANARAPVGMRTACVVRQDASVLTLRRRLAAGERASEANDSCHCHQHAEGKCALITIRGLHSFHSMCDYVFGVQGCDLEWIPQARFWSNAAY